MERWRDSWLIEAGTTLDPNLLRGPMDPPASSALQEEVYENKDGQQRDHASNGSDNPNHGLPSRSSARDQLSHYRLRSPG